MHPVLFEISNYTVSSYGVMAALGVLAALAVGFLNSKKAGLNPAAAVEAALFALVLGLAGARLAYVLVEWNFYAENPFRIFQLWDGGMVFYGGLLFAAPAGWLYASKVVRTDPWAALDAFAPGLALGHAMGRVGCFMAGCCYGMPLNLPWAVRFTHPLSVASPVFPLHPTQLYEAAVETVLFIYLSGRFRNAGTRDGRIFAEYLVYYSLIRIILEFYRGDSRGGAGPFSTSQFMGALILAAGLFLLKRTQGEKAAGS